MNVEQISITAKTFGLAAVSWCEPTERIAYVGPPLRRRTSAVPSADICRFAEIFSVKPNSLRLQSRIHRDPGENAGNGWEQCLWQGNLELDPQT